MGMRHRTRLALVATLAAVGIASSVTHAQLDPNDSANKPAEIEPLAAGSLLLDLAVAGNRLVAVGERGHVLLSDDQGATWRQAKSVPTRVMLTAVFFVDAQYGWAVGHDETILNTVDGGETWTRSHFAPEAQQPLLDLWFANRVSGIAVGAYGAYFTTNDGGRNWSSAKFAPPPAKPTAHARWRAGAGRRRAAAGLSPQSHRRRRQPAVRGGRGRPALSLRRSRRELARAALALRGQLLRPGADPRRWPARVRPARPPVSARPMRGETWTQLESHTTAMLTDGVAINDLRVVIGGLAGVLLVSGDAGETFRLTQQDDRKGVSALLPGPAGAVVVAGEGGVRTIRLDSAGS